MSERKDTGGEVSGGRAVELSLNKRTQSGLVVGRMLRGKSGRKDTEGVSGLKDAEGESG